MARLRAAADSMTTLLPGKERGAPGAVAAPLWRRVYADQLAAILSEHLRADRPGGMPDSEA